MATGKRSQVGRLVCEPLLVILSLVIILQNFRKRFSSGNVCWHRLGSHLHVAGLWLRFQVGGYIKLVGGELHLACENSHFFLLLAAFDILQGGTSGTQQQKFYTDNENQCL